MSVKSDTCQSTSLIYPVIKMMNTKESEVLLAAISLMLPENILDHFVLVKVEKEENDDIEALNQSPFPHKLHFYLDERDERTPEQKLCYTPNGFTECTNVADFPLRQCLVILHIRRRRYVDQKGKNVILCDYQLKAKGTSISPEFAAFLKETP